MDSPANRATQTPANTARPGEDDLLGVIADVEKQLASLKAVRAERDEAKQLLDDREAELNQREKKLREIGERLQASEREYESRGKELDRLEGILRQQKEKAEREFAAADEERKKAAAALQKREDEVKSLVTAIEAREQRLTENAAGLSRQREAMEARSGELTELDHKIRVREKEVAEQRQGALDAAKRADAADQAAKARMAEAEQARAEAAAEKKAAEKARAEAGSAGQLVDQLRGELAGSKKETEKARAQTEAAQKRIAEAEKSLEESRAELRRAGEAQASLMKELSERAKAAEKAGAGLEEARKAGADLSRQVEERDGKIQELNKRLGAATEKLREVFKALQEQAELVGQARALEAGVRERDQKIAALEAAAKAAPARDDAGQRAREKALKEAEAAVQERDGRIAALEAKLRAAPAGGAGGDAGASQRMVKLEEALRQAQAEIARAAAENKRLKAEGSAGGAESQGGATAEISEHILRRWKRLQLMRSMIREQGEKLRQAGEALRTKHQQAAAAPAPPKRDELASARASINQAKKQLQKSHSKEARHKAVATICYATLSLLVLGGLSWAVADQIAPATYIARATIAADTRGQPAAPDVLAEWQRYHESALADPQMVEVIAERMDRRGIVSLATPGALSQRLAKDMNHQSAMPGQLVVELKGVGAGRTMRELDTYIAAFVSQSNATHERRADGLSTMVAEQANTYAGAVKDPRPMYALAIFMMGMGAMAGAAFALWRRIMRAKTRFEEEQNADSIIDAANWSKPPELFARR